MPLIIVLYTGFTYVANWQVRSRWMLLYPYYALAQVLLLPAIGAAYYVYLAVKHPAAGRYRLRFVGAVA